MIRLRSRILELFPEQVMRDLYAICDNLLIPDNNTKARMCLDVLNEHRVNFEELGPGTNRLAILMDGYVVKIALDDLGLQDNVNEFTIGEELQPYVSKTYETNRLLCVAEYVTVISKDEFIEKTAEIHKILSVIGETYLLGDVGTVPKNFCNWGYRNNGELVMLDYAYVHRIKGPEVMCASPEHPEVFLAYDEDFHNMMCPSCGRKYTFSDIRRRISYAQEAAESDSILNVSYKLTEPVQDFKDGYDDDDEESDSNVEEASESLYINTNNTNREDMVDMNNEYASTEEEDFEAAMEAMRNISRGNQSNETAPVAEEPKADVTITVETNKPEASAVEASYELVNTDRNDETSGAAQIQRETERHIEGSTSFSVNNGVTAQESSLKMYIKGVEVVDGQQVEVEHMHKESHVVETNDGEVRTESTDSYTETTLRDPESGQIIDSERTEHHSATPEHLQIENNEHVKDQTSMFDDLASSERALTALIKVVDGDRTSYTVVEEFEGMIVFVGEQGVEFLVTPKVEPEEGTSHIGTHEDLHVFRISALPADNQTEGNED